MFCVLFYESANNLEVNWLDILDYYIRDVEWFMWSDSIVIGSVKLWLLISWMEWCDPLWLLWLKILFLRRDKFICFEWWIILIFILRILFMIIIRFLIAINDIIQWHLILLLRLKHFHFLFNFFSIFNLYLSSQISYLASQ